MLDFDKIIKNIKMKSPIIHSITNYVTVNDCANVILALGASPVMADFAEESAEITAGADSLLLNMGTMNPDKLKAMINSGRQANRDGTPVIFDPVGAGSSAFRKEAAKELFKSVNISLIRANMSEIKTLLSFSYSTAGIDACESDKITDDNISNCINPVRLLSKKTGAIVSATGACDIVSNGDDYIIIKNGHAIMSRVTGTGCMLSAASAAFLAANKNKMFESAAAAVCFYGICGELAYSENIGTASYKINLIDKISLINPKIIKEKAKYEIFSQQSASICSDR